MFHSDCCDNTHYIVCIVNENTLCIKTHVNKSCAVCFLYPFLIINWLKKFNAYYTKERLFKIFYTPGSFSYVLHDML